MPDLRSAVRPRAAACVIVVSAIVLGACAQNDDRAASDASTSSTSSASASATRKAASLPTPVQQLDINATEYKFEISPASTDALKPGWTLLRFHNVGAEAHQVMFARIKDGVNMSDLAAAGANDSSGSGAIAFVDMIGGVSYIGPGHDTTAMVNLTEGTVMAMCYVPDAKGVAHALMGMTTALTVSAPAGDAISSASKPSDDEVLGTIELSGAGYQIPGDIGRGWYHVKNTDSALHEMSLMRLGTSLGDDEVAALVADLAANKTPQVDLEAVGGMGAISAGFDGYLYLDLAPGDYLAVDFMPDPGKPRPHMLDGYYNAFSL